MSAMDLDRVHRQNPNHPTHFACLSIRQIVKVQVGIFDGDLN
jgi:hypothetical protein